MQEQKEATKRTNIAKFILGGATGFGIGGAIGGMTAGGPVLFIFPVMGAVGGASIGLLLGKRLRAIVMALAGAVGFGIASIPVLTYSGLGIGSTEQSMVIPPTAIIGGTLILFVLGAIQGFIGGISLGLDLKNRARAKYLVVASTIGFALGSQASWGFVANLPFGATYVIWGAVGGAALGTGLGCFERRKTRFQEDLSWQHEPTTWTKTTTFRAGIFLNLLLIIIGWGNALNLRVAYYNYDQTQLTGVITPTGVVEFRMPNLPIFIVLIAVTIGLNILMIWVLLRDKEHRRASIIGVLGLLAVLLPLIGGLLLPPPMTPI
ncbi:MAG: hypothetical protein HY670_06545 [Chloroflexi bacterium]|nr:hypothetical protein [Chloroflexota bacterium]